MKNNKQLGYVRHNCTIYLTTLHYFIVHYFAFLPGLIVLQFILY